MADRRDKQKLPGPRPWTRAHPGALFVFLLAGMVIIGAGIKLASPVLTPFLLGALVAVVSAPLVRWLRRRNVPRFGAVAVAVLADSAFLAGIGWLLSASAAELSAKLPLYSTLLTRSLGTLNERMQRFSPDFELLSLVHPDTLTRWVTSLLGGLANLIGNIVFALILASFLLYEVARPRPPASTRRVDGVGRAMREVNKYIAVKTLVSMITGCLVSLWLWAWDADLPLLFGLLAFVLNYIPNLGSIVAAVPAIALSLLHGGFVLGTEVAIGYLLINITIGYAVEPRVMGRVLGLSPVVVLLSVVVWGWLLGVMGALLSALLTVLVKLGLSSTEDLRPYALFLGPISKPEPEEDLTELVVPQSRIEEPTKKPDQSA